MPSAPAPHHFPPDPADTPLLLMIHWNCWCTNATDALILLNQDQDILADLSIATCSSLRFSFKNLCCLINAPPLRGWWLIFWGRLLLATADKAVSLFYVSTVTDAIKHFETNIARIANAIPCQSILSWLKGRYECCNAVFNFLKCHQFLAGVTIF